MASIPSRLVSQLRCIPKSLAACFGGLIRLSKGQGRLATTTSTKYPNLFTPVVLGEFKLKNRFVLASLTRARSGPTRVPNEHNVEYYRQRAPHFGLLLAEATTVCPLGEGWAGSPSIYTEAHRDGWKRVCDAVHKEGGLIACQLWFIGRAGHSSFLPDGEKTTVSASNIPIASGETRTATGTKVAYETPRALSVGEIAKIVEHYGKAAELCKAAGFDGVEIHAANGYLIDQFLQSCSNNRTDAYGGSVENRFRFLREIITRILKVYPGGRIGIKLSPNGAFNGMGSKDNNETFNYVLGQLNAFSLAYVQVMDGLAFGYHEKCAAQGLADFRKVYRGSLMANCGYTPEDAEARVAEGLADCVSFGRATLANPDYPERLRNGWPVADMLDMSHWYAGTGPYATDPGLGYTDQPKYKP